MRYKEIISEAVQRRYIRFGDIPANERSGIGRSPNYLKHLSRTSDEEIGVSVFDTEWSPARNRWEIVDVGNFATLDALLLDKRPAFLVTGRVVGYGMDEESLLRNVKIVQQLRYDEMWVRGWGNDGACEQYSTAINEAFNTVQPHNWTHWQDDTAQEVMADFQIGDGHFKVMFKEKAYERGIWELSFYRNGTLDLTGTGNAATVLSTVMAITREFISTQDPRYIGYSAKNDEGSRNKLYPKLMAKLMKEFPQYLAHPPKKMRTYTSYDLERPAKAFVPPPAPEPAEPHKPLSQQEWDELDAFMDEFESRR